MKLSILAPLAVAALAAVAGCSKPDQPAQTGRSTTTTTTTTTQAGTDADNTRRNDRDRQGSTATPFDQGESEADRNLTQQIRKAVVADDSLSTTAHNVKIITNNGVVTLRGPVKSEAEKSSIATKAKQVSGVSRVDNQLEVDTK